MRTIILALILLSTMALGKPFGFNSKVFKQSLNNVPASRLSKSMTSFNTSPNLSGFMKTADLVKYTPEDKMAKIAQEVANKSPFANKLMGTKEPLYVMDMYAKHGDDFFKASKNLTTKVSNIDPKALTKISQKMPSFPKLAKMDDDLVLNKFVSVMKATGKVGVDITKGIAKIAIDNPKSAIAGVMYGWFLADPEGFSKKLKEFGGSIQEFAAHIGSLVGDVVVGGAAGLAGAFVESAKEHATPTNIMIFVSLLLLWILWKLRSFIASFIPKSDDGFKKQTIQTRQPKNKKNKGRF